MSRNDNPVAMESLANAVRTLAREGATAVHVRDGCAKVELKGGVALTVELQARTGNDPSGNDPSDDTPATDDTEDTSDDTPATEGAAFRCTCGDTWGEGEGQAAHGHAGGKGDGHEIVRTPDDDTSDDTPAKADEGGDDDTSEPATGDALRDTLSPKDLTEGFARNNAEALTEGTGYDATRDAAAKALARHHGGDAEAFAEAFGHGIKCAEGCGRVVPSFDATEGDTCPMCDPSDDTDDTDDTHDEGGMTKAEYEEALIDEGFAPAKAAAKAEARFGE